MRAGAIMILTCMLTMCFQVSRAGAESFAEDLTSPQYVSKMYPERVTGSYQASKFVADTQAYFTKMGFRTLALKYEVSVKEAGTSQEIHVLGENLLILPGAGKPEKLVVAFYDVQPPWLSSVRPIPGAIAAFPVCTAAKLASSESILSGNVGVALVSGHFQGGAGALALKNYLQESGMTPTIYEVIGYPGYSPGQVPVVFHGGAYPSVETVSMLGPMLGPFWPEVIPGDADLPGHFKAQGAGVLQGSEGALLAGENAVALTVGFPYYPNVPYQDPSQELDLQQAVSVLERLLASDATLLSAARPETIFVRLGQSVFAIPKNLARAVAWVSIGVGIAAFIAATVAREDKSKKRSKLSLGDPLWALAISLGALTASIKTNPRLSVILTPSCLLAAGATLLFHPDKNGEPEHKWKSLASALFAAMTPVPLFLYQRIFPGEKTFSWVTFLPSPGKPAKVITWGIVAAAALCVLTAATNLLSPRRDES